MRTNEVILCILTGAITVMIAHSIGNGAALLASMCFVLAVVAIVARYWADPVQPQSIDEADEPATWQTERLED